MSYFDAKMLWDDILAFAKAQWELGAEGNSGEFHSDKEQRKLEAEEFGGFQ